MSLRLSSRTVQRLSSGSIRSGGSSSYLFLDELCDILLPWAQSLRLLDPVEVMLPFQS